MTNDGMTPVLTITDAPVAYMIAEALRSQADACRRTADRMMSSAYESVSGVNARRASLSIAHAERLDAIATEAERQGYALEALDAPTQLMPRITVPVR